MEIKYLSEQDTGNLCFPVVHVKGIVGLNVNPTTGISSQDIPLANKYLLTGSKVKITYFDNIVSISADIQLNGEGLKYLQAGNTIEISNSGFNNTEDVALDTITTLNNAVVSGCMGYVWIKDAKLYIKATCKKITFSADAANPGGVIEREDTLSFDKIVGNALSTTKSFAPIKPVLPKGYVTFTISQRVSEFVIGPIEYVGDFEMTTDHGRLEYTKSGESFVVSVTNTTQDYNLTIKGNMSYIVYPQAIQITAVEMHDCAALTWFSVNKRGGGRPMTQNTSIKSFAVYGKHRMTNMSNFLSGLPELTTIPNLYTTGVTSLIACFKNDPKLLQLPEMDLSTVNGIQELCSGCTSLSYIPPTLDWSNIVDAGSAFYRCSSLNTKLELNTENIMYGDSMFFGCNNLPEVQMGGRYLQSTENMFVECTSLGVLVIRNMTRSLNIQDTNMKNKAVIENFMASVGTAPADTPAVLSLPQSIPLYGFDNNFIKQVTDKNWRLS